MMKMFCILALLFVVPAMCQNADLGNVMNSLTSSLINTAEYLNSNPEKAGDLVGSIALSLSGAKNPEISILNDRMEIRVEMDTSAIQYQQDSMQPTPTFLYSLAIYLIMNYYTEYEKNPNLKRCDLIINENDKPINRMYCLQEWLSDLQYVNRNSNLDKKLQQDNGEAGEAAFTMLVSKVVDTAKASGSAEHPTITKPTTGQTIADLHPPVLSDAKVTPECGKEKSDEFTFTVVYKDVDGDDPTETNIAIRGWAFDSTRTVYNSDYNDMTKVSGDSKQGAVYSFKTQLPEKGVYNYTFYFTNSKGVTVRLPKNGFEDNYGLPGPKAGIECKTTGQTTSKTAPPVAPAVITAETGMTLYEGGPSILPSGKAHIKITKNFDANSNTDIYIITIEDANILQPVGFIPKNIVATFSVDDNVYIKYDDMKIEYSVPDFAAKQIKYVQYKLDPCKEKPGDFVKALAGITPPGIILGGYDVFKTGAETFDCWTDTYAWSAKVSVNGFDADTPKEYQNGKLDKELINKINEIKGYEVQRNNRHVETIAYSNDPISGKYIPRSVRITIPVRPKDDKINSEMRMWIDIQGYSGMGGVESEADPIVGIGNIVTSTAPYKLGIYFENTNMFQPK